MAFCRLALAIMIALLASNALAEGALKPVAFDRSAYPDEVRKALRHADEECRSDGGGEVTFAPDTVRKVDLTGDGRDDYIVDYRDAKCGGHEGTYCGTGGCLMQILVTLPNGRVRQVFEDNVRGYEIEPDLASRPRVPHSIRFQLHGGFCGGHGNPSCYKVRAITTRPFAFTMPQ